MERLTTRMQRRPAMYTLTIFICQTARYQPYVHSTYHTPNKEIVIGRCGIRESMHSKMLHLLMCSYSAKS